MSNDNINGNNNFLSDASLDMIGRFMLGGAALGGGGGLITSLINYLNHLADQKATDKDDDVLYVYKDREKKAAAEQSSMEAPLSSYLDIDTGIATAGGVLSLLGAYALVRKIYSNMRKREAQQELDDSQRAFVETQGYKTMNKKAAEEAVAEEVIPKQVANPGLANILAGLPTAIPILLGLAAGGSIFKLLDKQFPVRKPKVKAPRKVEIIDPDAPDPLQEKEASVQDDLGDSDACEFIVRTVLAEKRANSDLRNLVAAVATQGARGVRNVVDNLGYPTALDMVKGASVNRVHPFKEHAAVCYLTKSARLRDLVALTAAGEFAEAHPDLMAAAASLPEESRETLYKIACVMGRAYRIELAEEFGIRAPEGEITKRAFTEEMMEEMMDRVAEHIDSLTYGDPAVDNDDDDDEGSDYTPQGVDDDESSDTSGEEAGISDPGSPSRKKKNHKVKFVLNGTSSKRVMEGMPSQDVIDQFLNPYSADA